MNNPHQLSGGHAILDIVGNFFADVHCALADRQRGSLAIAYFLIKEGREAWSGDESGCCQPFQHYKTRYKTPTASQKLFYDFNMKQRDRSFPAGRTIDCARRVAAAFSTGAWSAVCSSSGPSIAGNVPASCYNKASRMGIIGSLESGNSDIDVAFIHAEAPGLHCPDDVLDHRAGVCPVGYAGQVLRGAGSL